MVKISVITSLYNCSDYLLGYFASVDLIVNKNECEFLLLHNAPKPDEIRIIEKNIEYKPWFRHIIIEEREGLYSTWNRGVKISKGEYCAVWNVDDIREADSLLNQKYALDNNQDALISFGDIWFTNQYGRFKQKKYLHPTFETNKKAYMYQHMIGCFPFWRKKLHDQIFYFEEQFRLISDLDFQIRVTRIGVIAKIDTPTGYYLNDSIGKLSSNKKIQITEMNALHLRYANFNRLNWLYIIPALLRYDIFNLHCFSNKYPIKDIFPNYNYYWISRLPLIFISIFMLPKDILRAIYHKIKQK